MRVETLLKHEIEADFAAISGDSRAIKKKAKPADRKWKKRKVLPADKGVSSDHVLANVDRVMGASANISQDIVQGISKYHEKRRRPRAEKRQILSKKKRVAQESSVFTDEDFEKWQSAPFINSKVNSGQEEDQEDVRAKKRLKKKGDKKEKKKK